MKIDIIKDRVARCISVFLLLCTVGCGSGSTISGVPVSIEPIAPTELRTLGVPGLDFHTSIGVGNNRVVALSRSVDSTENLSLIDAELKLLWTNKLARDYMLDQAGIHELDGSLYMPVMHHQPNDVSIYKVIRLDAKNGKTLDSNTLMRFGQHDRGELMHDLRASKAPTRTARASWSPDSSKFAILKYYPSSTGRLNMDLMLFKRGFVLATKANIDFRFDTTKQRMLDLKLDNDGVAYLYLYNFRDSALEIGRFEILGSKQLRTIKHAMQAIPEALQLDIGPRGHTYAAYSTVTPGDRVLRLVDFDFYLDRANVRENPAPGRTDLSLQEEPLHLLVMPLLDRIVLSFELSKNPEEREIKQFGYDLDLRPVFTSTYPRPVERLGRHSFYSTPKFSHGQYGHFFIESGILRFRGVDIMSGLSTYETEWERLATVGGVYPHTLDRGITRGRYLWITSGGIYRLTLPAR